MIKCKWVIGFLIIFNVCSCREKSGQETKNLKKDSIGIKNIQALKQSYDQAQGGIIASFHKKHFLLMFPSDFESFISLYGFDDVKGKMPLYDSYFSHINFFCQSLDHVPEFNGFSKLISLGIEGRWDADAVELLQRCIIHHVNENPNLAINELRRLGESDIRSFWKFFYDGPHPSDKSIEKMHVVLFEKMNAIDTGMSRIMRREYQQQLQESELHGQ